MRQVFSEHHDIADAHPAIFARMTARIEAITATSFIHSARPVRAGGRARLTDPRGCEVALNRYGGFKGAFVVCRCEPS